MMLMIRALSGLLLVSLLLAGCGFGRSRPPLHLRIAVDPEEEIYVLDGRTMGREQLWEELRYIADVDRNPVSGYCRARIGIISRQGISSRRVQELVNYLNSQGVHNIYFTAQ